jgi:peroxiredoxin
MHRTTKTVGIAIVAVILAGAVGVSIFAATRTPSSTPDGSSATREPARSAAPSAKSDDAKPAPGATAATAPTKPRAGRVIPVDVAFKELDLIKPARQKIADDFTLATPKGQKVKLSDYRGKLVFMNFWATWCPPCREEMPAMQRLWDQQKDKGFVMLAISVDHDPDLVPSFVKNHKFTFPVLVDPKMEAANAYGVRALPSSFIIDRQGNMTAYAIGPRNWDNDAANSLIEGLAR